MRQRLGLETPCGQSGGGGWRRIAKKQHGAFRSPEDLADALLRLER